MKESYDLEKLIDDGFERNLLCYDYDAPPGVLTSRLLYLMRTIARENDVGRLTKILIPWGVKKEGGFFEKLGGFEIIQVKDYTQYYLRKNSCLPQVKVRCLIGICENGNVLLGTY